MGVHCAGGFRVSIAASLLARAGHNVILVDDDYSTAVESGFAHRLSCADGPRRQRSGQKGTDAE